jgi:hypothetical protein
MASLYLGWIYYSRWGDHRALLRRLEESKRAQDRAVVEAYGGGRFNILGFYATPAIVLKGQKAQLCYSVINAKSVRIEPPVENVWPSLSRCVDVRPVKDTVYQLLAEDAQGNRKTASLTVKVTSWP